ncbi:SPFH domain-containing protein [Streptomyces sp. DT24]|uniref:SPFH domain-containing protein n=1 Tax=Streptomyces sp. DT24 TaxID=3416520 RepID=UPI003CF0F3C2
MGTTVSNAPGEPGHRSGPGTGDGSDRGSGHGAWGAEEVYGTGEPRQLPGLTLVPTSDSAPDSAPEPVEAAEGTEDTEATEEAERLVPVPAPVVEDASREEAGTAEVAEAAEVAEVADPEKPTASTAPADPVRVPAPGDRDAWRQESAGAAAHAVPVRLPAPGDARQRPVLAHAETAAPVHLYFSSADHDRSDAVPLPGVGTRPQPGERPVGARRTPQPRSPRVRAATRPAPPADPGIKEWPGPALPGWTALLTAAVGLALGGVTLWWIGALPAAVLSGFGLAPRPFDGIGVGVWPVLAALLTVVLFALGGLGRGRVGSARVLTLFGRYRGSVRRTGLVWVSPLLLRRRVDVRLRHWRSEPLPAVDADGTALRVVVLVVWRTVDTARATLGVADHERYLREQVDAAMARVLSQLPADAFHEDTPTLRDAEAVGAALTRMLKAECVPVGIEVYSAQPTSIAYAPEIAAAMRRRRIAAIDAKHRDSVLTSVVDAVADTVGRLTDRGIVELDDYERKSLVRDLTVAFYNGRGGGETS